MLNDQHLGHKNLKAILLLPLSWLFRLIVAIRSWGYRRGYLKSTEHGIPVVVVGNITVGGTGKTPIVVELVKQLSQAGLNPGIVSRGYKSNNQAEPLLVTAETDVSIAGDEPSMLAKITDVPVCISSNRSEAVRMLAETNSVDVVVSDDGLQHYAMRRHAEIVVVDGMRGNGNGWMLPSGPMRERVSRIQQVQLVAVQRSIEKESFNAEALNQLLGLTIKPDIAVGSFLLQPSVLKSLSTGEEMPIGELAGQHVHAVAGIGNPQRFFKALSHYNLKPIEHPMPDHHHFAAVDVQFGDNLTVLLTSKDAVKVKALPIDLSGMYEVAVEVKLDDALSRGMNSLVKSLAASVDRY